MTVHPCAFPHHNLSIKGLVIATEVSFWADMTVMVLLT